MSAFRLIVASLVHHWRIHFAVGLGVAAGTAVLTGALVVGDSVRGSLRALALERLGRIDEVLLVERFFRAELADELADELGGKPSVQENFGSVVPVILLQGSVEHPQREQTRRASKVTVLGCDADFWALGLERHDVDMTGDVVALSEPLARDIGAEVGDEVVLRIPLASQVPADTPLGKKSDIRMPPR